MTDTFFKTNLSFPHTASPIDNVVVIETVYRISVFRSRLFRVEYDPKGVFEDRPTQTVWHRQAKASFQVNQDESIYTVTTDDWTITLDTSKDGLSGLDIHSNDGRYHCTGGKPDKRNLFGTHRTLDGANGKVKLEQGLLSKDGITMYDDSGSVVFEDGEIVGVNNNHLDFYFFGYGHDYASCIKDFYLISGNTPLIPKYVFGNWWSRYWNYSDAELRQLINDFTQRDIPLSVCIIDMDWHITDVPQELGGGWTGYTWNKDLFPNPKELLDWLRKKNKLKVSLNLHPADGIRPFDDCYEAVCNTMGIDPSEQQIIPFDLTNEKFVEAYFKDVHHQLEQDGVDFWWIDWQQGTKSKMKNLDPLFALNHYHFIEGLNRHKHGYFIFSRWSKLGSHRYPIGFSGDTHSTWKSLKFQPYFTATASNVGYGWWSHDIGGHQQGIQSSELFIRWVQLGVFSPVNRLHSTKSFYQRREPWRYDMETEQILTHYLQLRHRFIPYIHTFNHLHANGDVPLIRPLYYTYPEKKQAYSHKNQYFFGSELMVRPFTSKVNKTLQLASETMWFKEGNWFHFLTGDHIKHPGTYRFYGNKWFTNIYAKAGAIVPMATNHNDGISDLPKELTIHLFPGNNNTFTLIEDKGSVIYHTTISLTYNGNKMSVHITSDSPKPIKRNLHLLFRSVHPDASIESSLESITSEVQYGNTIKATIPFDMQQEQSVSISHDSDLIQNPFDYTFEIMNAIEQSTLDTEVKNEIGYIDFNKPHESRGWLSWDKPLEDKYDDIKDLKIPKSVKNYLRTILEYQMKNGE